MEEEEQGYSPNPNPFEVERGFRKRYWQFGLKALAGVGVLALVVLLKLPSKWLDLPFLLLGAGLVLVNLNAISMLATVQNRYRNGPEDDTPLKFQDRTERQVHIASYVMLVITILVTMPLSRHVENIVEEGRFVLLIGGVGVVLAAFVLWWIKRSMPTYYQRNSEARAGAVLGLFFSILAWVVLGSAWIDRSSAEARAQMQRFAVKDTGSNLKSGASYVVVYLPGQGSEDFRIQVRRKQMDAIVGRDSIDLRVGKGDLGFTHVLGVALE